MPSLKRVNFNDILTFDRNTDKTGFVLQSDGFGNQVPTLKTFAPNEPAKVIVNPLTKERLGISIHGQRTNRVLRSNNPTNSADGWEFGSYVKSDQGELLGLPVSRFTWEGANNTREDATGLNNILVSVSSDVDDYMYVILKKGNTSKVLFGQWTPRAHVVFDFETESFEGIQQAENQVAVKLSDDVYLVGFKVSDVARTFIRIFPTNIFSGGAYRVDNGDYIDLLHVQVEQGAFATPPIITNGTTVTRLADNARITDLDQQPWWNPNEGTFVVEYPQGVLGAFTSSGSVFGVGTSSNNSITLNTAGNNLLRIRPRVNNVGASQSVGISADGTPFKFAIAYKDGEMVGYGLNGSSESVNLPFSFGIAPRIYFGATEPDSVFLTGMVIAKIHYEPRAYSAEELQQASKLGV